MALPVGHIPVGYPTLADGLHSAQHLAMILLGREEGGSAQVAAHGWNAAGAGLSVLLPLDGPMQAKAALVLTPEETATLESFVALKVDDAERAKIDWKSLLKTILPLILKLLI